MQAQSSSGGAGQFRPARAENPAEYGPGRTSRSEVREPEQPYDRRIAGPAQSAAALSRVWQIRGARLRRPEDGYGGGIQQHGQQHMDP